MGSHRSLQQLTAGLIIAGAISQINGQEQTTGSDVSPTPTISGSSSNAPSATASGSIAESSSTDVPLELWGIANGLLSSYYPSTTVSNVASLTWPSVVVIGSSTYTREPPTASPTTSPTTSPSTLVTSASSSQDVSRPVATDSTAPNEAEPSDTTEEQPNSPPKDRTLGIALGVAFGALALGLMAFALLCIHHRQKKHGGTGLFPSRRRRAGSPTDSEVGAWRARHPHMGLVANVASGNRPMTQIRDNDDSNNLPPREWVKRYNRLQDQQTPPAHLHPAFMQRHDGSVGTASESNPFFPPADHDHNELPPQQNIGASGYNNERNERNDYHPGYPNRQPSFDVTTTPYTAYRPEEDETRRSQSSHPDERRRSSFSSERSYGGDVNLERNSRPPTPFSPMMMLQTSLPPFQREEHLEPQAQPQTPNQPPSHPQQPNSHHTRDPSNPFTSPSDPSEPHQYQTFIPNHPHETYQPEDGEDDDIVHPMLQHPYPQPPPSKSPARRHSPMVHYPSWSEVSEFDFTGESSTSLPREQQQQQQRHSWRKSGGNGAQGEGEGGGDAYGRDRESVVGRWELA
jgi:hypothetical protein